MDEVIILLNDLIKINSINPFEIKYDKSLSKWILGGNENEITDFLKIKLEEAGFKVEKQFVHENNRGEKFYNLIAEKGSGNKSILFYGHMDTQVSETWPSREMALNPREIVREYNGKKIKTITGLGSNDMKAGLAVIITALKNINPIDYKIKVAFGVDEEFYSLGANTLANSSFLDDVIGIIVPELGDGPNMTHGPSTIMLGRLGRCEYVINVPGSGGHGAQANDPNLINATTECAKITFEIDKISKSHYDTFQFMNNVDGQENKISGSFFVNKIDAGEETLKIPLNGRIVVDHSFTPNSSVDKGLTILKNLIDNMYSSGKLNKVYIDGQFKPVTVETKNRPTPPNEAYIISENNLFTKFIKEVISSEVGFVNYNFGRSVADENVFTRIRPNIPLLVVGPTGENCHKDDEWVDIESVIKLKKVYASIGKNFIKYIK
jgi:acetylornithine deacetylase/succinyl-diaminopimelate desuccinylase-like protein